MSNKFNYIIVGQGLAGTCLAFQLQNLGQKVLIIDKKRENSSSKVAAGLYNPITGRKMVLTWKAHQLFNYMYDFYKKLEHELDSHFLHETTIYRPFVSLEEQNEWMGKSTQKDYKPFIAELYTNSTYGKHVNDPYGGLALEKCGYLNIPFFLEAARNHLKKEGSLIDEEFEYDNINVNESVNYKTCEADKIIFCTGPESADNQYFNWLPFSLVKGEVIDIKPTKGFEVIYNRGVFIMPRKDGKYVVGATYDTKDRTLTTTEKAKNTLIEKLSAIFTLNYSIEGQRAGIRPATKDRRPFTGIHPEMKQIGVFNGLGTKGVTLAPYFSRQFANHLVSGKDLDNEVNISRYYSLYYQYSS